MPGLDIALYGADETLSDGTIIHIRLIRPDDKQRLLEHFSGLSERARYLRFLGPKRHLNKQELARFTELDFDRQVGLAGTLQERGEERFIGVGRYARIDESARAEIALAVLDGFQGLGLGPMLLHHLAHMAHIKGITEFEADVLGDNNRMLMVLRKSGCIIRHANSAGAVHFTLQCPERFESERTSKPQYISFSNQTPRPRRTRSPTTSCSTARPTSTG